VQRLEHGPLGVAARTLGARVLDQERLHLLLELGAVLAPNDDLGMRDQLRFPDHLQALGLGRKLELEALEVGGVVGRHVGLAVGHGQGGGLVRAHHLAGEAGLHCNVVGQEKLQLRHDEARQRTALAARQAPALGLGQQALERGAGPGLAREQQRAVARQAVMARDLGDHAHAALRDRVERHLPRQEGHVDLVALDGLLERLVGVDREDADRPPDGAAEIRQQRLPVVARLEGAAQRQDAEAQRGVVRGGCRPHRGHGRKAQQGEQDAAPQEREPCHHAQALGSGAGV